MMEIRAIEKKEKRGEGEIEIQGGTWECKEGTYVRRPVGFCFHLRELSGGLGVGKGEKRGQGERKEHYKISCAIDWHGKRYI